MTALFLTVVRNSVIATNSRGRRRSQRVGSDTELALGPLDVKMRGSVGNTKNHANVGIGFAFRHPIDKGR